jgi:hypothetical protein
MKLLAIGMMVATCTGAMAETVSASIDRYTFPPLIVQMPGVDLHAGQYQARIDGIPETAWCAEVGQFLQFGTAVGYRVVDADVAFGRSIAEQLDAILSYAATGRPVDARESANMQVDVWRAIATQPLSGLYTSPLTVEAFLLSNENRQDLIVGRPYVAIDEPEPGLLLLLGIGLMAIRSRYG